MSSAQQAFLNLRNGRPSKLQPPISNFENNLTSEEKAVLKSVLSCSVAGGAETVKDGLKTFIEQTGVDEVMIAAQIFDHNARLKSYEIVAEVFKEI